MNSHQGDVRKITKEKKRITHEKTQNITNKENDINTILFVQQSSMFAPNESYRFYPFHRVCRDKRNVIENPFISIVPYTP